MKKTSKLLLVVILMLSLMLVCSVKVNAAQTIDVDGYTDLDALTPNTSKEEEKKEEDNKQEEQKTEENKEEKKEETKTEENKEDKKEEEQKTEQNQAGTANKGHAQTGEFNNIAYVSSAIILAIAIFLAYSKLKKYKF